MPKPRQVSLSSGNPLFPSSSFTRYVPLLFAIQQALKKRLGSNWARNPLPRVSHDIAPSCENSLQSRSLERPNALREKEKRKKKWPINSQETEQARVGRTDTHSEIAGFFLLFAVTQKCVCASVTCASKYSLLHPLSGNCQK